MDKKLLFGVLATMLLMSVVAAQEVTINRLEVHYKYDYAVIEKYRIGMEAVIDYVDELGKDSSQLVTYKDQFKALTSDLEGAADEDDEISYNSTISEMKDVVTSFSQEARAQVGNNAEEARARIESAWEENEDYLYSLVKEARELHRDRNTELFDYCTAKAEDVIEKLEAQEYDVDEVKEKLDEIEGKRKEFIDVMNDVIEACSDKWIGECKETPEAEAYSELRDELIEDFEELRDLIYEAVLGSVITKGEEVLTNAEEALASAEEKGIDVTAEKAKLGDVRSLFEDAKAEYEQKNYEEVVDLLRSASDLFNELREEVRERRGG